MTDELDPMMLRMQLKNELRQLRDAAERSQLDVATALDWSTSKVIRIEAGSVSVTPVDVRAMLAFYGVTDPARVEELTALAKRARERPWWYEYRDWLSPSYRTYLGHESSATVLRVYQPTLVPGLLQTEGYAREVLTKGGAKGDRLESQIGLRLQRQERMAGDHPVQQHFIFDESAVRRVVGGRDVMRRQLEYLRGLLGRVHMHVVPFTHGLHQNAITPYVLLELPSNEMVLYLESPGGDLLSTESSGAATGVTPSAFVEAFWEFEEELEREPDVTEELIDDALQALRAEA